MRADAVRTVTAKVLTTFQGDCYTRGSHNASGMLMEVHRTQAGIDGRVPTPRWNGMGPAWKRRRVAGRPTMMHCRRRGWGRR